jgi:hypothetical protein
VDVVEEVKFPVIFGDVSVTEFTNFMRRYVGMFNFIDGIFQDEEAFNFIVPSSDKVLGPWFLMKLEELVSKLKKEEPAPLPLPSPISTDVVSLPEVNKLAPLLEPEKAKSIPPPKKGTKGAPGKPVAAPCPPPPLPSSRWAPAPKDAPPILIAKHTRCK